MAKPILTTLTIFSEITVCLLITSVVNSVSSPSDDYEIFIPGAVAYWPMTSGTKGSDVSGNINHATFEGLTYTDGPTNETQGAVHFNGSSNSYAKVTNAPSMDIGKYPGFSFSGFFRLRIQQNKSASLIDWSGEDGYGVFLVVTSEKNIQLQLYPRVEFNEHKAEFPIHTLINGDWRFIGVSYDKATGLARAFIGGQPDKLQLDKNIVAGSDKTKEIGLGIDLADKTLFNYNGDMNCMMLFNYALKEVDFSRVWAFCRTTNSTPQNTLLPNVTMSNITTATVSWTQSTGIFSGYNITIERKQCEIGHEIVHPAFIHSSATSLKSVLTDLVPGATYRVHVWHMQDDIKGRARSSAWFDTTSVVVVYDLIKFTEITATSANVSWKDVTGNYDDYLVNISPITGGAKADPSTVPRGTTTTSLRNLTPRTRYTVSITAKSGRKMNPPSNNYFHTPEPPSLVVEYDSIVFPEITETSANVRWKEVSGIFDNYIVNISPTKGGAKADPSTVPRETTTTSLQNLLPGINYIITIRTKIGSNTTSPTRKSFQTPGLKKTISWEFIVIGIMVAIILFLIGFVVYPRVRAPVLNCRETQNHDAAGTPML